MELKINEFFFTDLHAGALCGKRIKNPSKSKPMPATFR